MGEFDDVRKAALSEAEKALIIEVETRPETVVVKDAINMTVRFFARSPDSLLKLVPTDVNHPVVEMVGEPGRDEQKLTYLVKEDTGLYSCRLFPTVPGTHAYKVKESQETDVGELVEVEVLNEHTHGLLTEFFDKLIGRKA